MARGLDHIVHAVRDLDAAVETYRRLGFTVGARNRHPWGTHNHLVQFPGFFIEILTVAEPEKLGEDGLSILFGVYNQSFLERQEGFSLLILESGDAGADERDFVRTGIAASSALRFEREAKRPDGSTIEVAFSLVFARDPQAPGVGLAVCQQHYPENFWNAAFQTHANGAIGVAGMVMVAENPAKHEAVLSVFAGAPVTQAKSDGISIATSRGDIDVMRPAAFAEEFGVTAPDLSEGARLAALRLACSDLPKAAASISDGGFEARAHKGRLVVPADMAFGATLILEPARR